MSAQLPIAKNIGAAAICFIPIRRIKSYQSIIRPFVYQAVPFAFAFGRSGSERACLKNRALHTDETNGSESMRIYNSNCRKERNRLHRIKKGERL